jgi:isopentenyl-diphosphate delta-isomerase
MLAKGLIEHEVVEIFTATCTNPPKVIPNPEEVMEVKWVDQIELGKQGKTKSR